MDQKALINNLNKLLYESNKEERKYAEAWLNEADFGGLYYSGKYILTVRAEHVLKNRFEEISSVLRLLDKKAPKEREYILRVVVLNPDDYNYRHGNDDLIVFSNNKEIN